MNAAADHLAEPAKLAEEVELLRGENKALREQIAWLKQQVFGPGRSETLDRAQQLIALDNMASDAPERPVETITYQREKGPRAARTAPAESFAHLPVKETIVIVPDEVQAQPEAFEQIGEERTFEVDIVAPKLFKREIVRPKFRRKSDRTQPPVLAAAPARPVVGGYASAGLLAWVVIAKFVDHLPLFRQEKMLSRWGARISRQTLGEWVALVADWLEPLYKRLLQQLLVRGYLQVDETPIRCQDPDRPGSTVQGYLWVADHPDGDTVYRWANSRRHAELDALLGDFSGLLQSDAYGAYPAFAAAHPGVDWVGCWAHARRGFFDALQDSPKAAGVILRLIGKLYAHERRWDEAGITEERAALRTAHFARPLYWLHKLATGLRHKHLHQSKLGKACGYLLAHWDPLVAHCRHSHTRLDNNLVENAVRPTKLGAKNWLFVGHPDAGPRVAIIYSLLISCQRHGKDPLAYLRDVLARLPAMTNQDDLATLLPANWQPPATS
ncbi:MAG TPA: IS66 family transposase [Opitutaceae bacterium]|nr:IS66 family transposase [Opitutaceae bacterium]